MTPLGGVSRPGLTAAEVAATKALVSVAGNLVFEDPSAGRANADLINAALAAGYPVAINKPGTFWLSKPVRVPSYAELKIGPRTLPKLAALAKCAIIRNRDAQNALPVAAMTISAGVVTLIERGHDYSVGQSVYVEGCLTNTTLNGPKVITAVTDTSWSFAGSGALPTNTNEQRIMTSVYNPLSGSAFVRASNVVTVADPGHQRQQGDHVYVAGLGGASSFNGKAKVISVITGVSWTYASTGVNETATGTANVLGNTGIRLDLRFDGNRAGQAPESAAGLDEWLDTPGQFINVGNMLINAPMIQDFWWRGLSFWNAAEIDVPLCRFYRGSVGIQFDSFCDGIRVGKSIGRQMSDDVLAWGVVDQSGPFGETASPSGPGNMGSLTVDEIDGDSPTGLFKMYCAAGYDLGDINIGILRGLGRGVASDSQVGVSGGTFKSLRIGQFLAGPGSLTNIIGINLAGMASGGSVVIDQSVDNYSGSTNNFFLSASTPALQLLDLANHESMTYTAGTYAGVQIGLGSVVGRLRVRGRLSAGLNSAGTAAINCATGGRVRELILENVEAYGSGAYNSASYAGRLVREEVGGRIDRLVIRGVRAADGQLDSVFWLGGAGHTEIEVHGLTQGLADDTVRGKPGAVFNDGSNPTKSITVMISALHWRDVANRVFQFGGGGTHRIRGSGIVPLTAAPFRFVLLTAGTHSTSIDCPEAWIDLGANAGAPPARLVPQPGDRVYNSNATGGGPYYRNAANTAWVAV